MVNDRCFSVSLFGPFTVRLDDLPIHLALTGRTLDLLRYLLVNADQPLRREQLADLFWPESPPSRQRSALNSAIWRIRGAISPIRGFTIRSTADALILQVCAAVRIDAIEFTEAYANAARGGEDFAESESRLEAVIDRCNAPFLDGSTEDWALVEREKFFELRMRSLMLLMRRCGEARRFEDAAAYGRQILAEDPFRESVHCEMMWLYVLSGRRVKALAQYHECAKRLRDELGIEPMAELRALYDHIRTELNEDPAGAAKTLARAVGPSHDRLDSVLDAIERSRLEVYSALCKQHY